MMRKGQFLHESRILYFFAYHSPTYFRIVLLLTFEKCSVLRNYIKFWAKKRYLLTSWNIVWAALDYAEKEHWENQGNAQQRRNTASFCKAEYEDSLRSY